MITHDELHELRFLSMKLHRVLEKKGAPLAARRFVEDIERAITWHHNHEEKKK